MVGGRPGVPSSGAQGRRGVAQPALRFGVGMRGPAGTPRGALARLNAETVKALQDPQINKTLRAGHIFPIGNTPEEFAAMMREGHAAWGRLIREAGVHAASAPRRLPSRRCPLLPLPRLF